jgi:hypothetical protein
MEEQGKKAGPGVIPPEAWEHARAAGSEILKTVASMLPPEVGEHGRAARKEMLLAMRGMIDAAIARIDGKTDTTA